MLASGYNGTWKEQFFKWPDEQNEIVYKAKTLADAKQNVYFTAHLFDKPQSLKDNVLPTETIQADLDGAEVHSLAIRPSIVVETSPGRYQAYWIVKPEEGELLPPSLLEELSRKLTYSIENADHSGWSLGHRVRLPDTINFKYDAPHHIKIVSNNPRKLTIDEIDALPDLDVRAKELLLNGIEWLEQPHLELALQPTIMMKELADDDKIPKATYRQYNNLAKDRSVALWKLTLDLIRAGIGRDLTYFLCYHSSNNKFRDRYQGTRDLRKDILRAEASIERGSLDIREALKQIKKDASHGTMYERYEQMASLIINNMSIDGNFVHAKNETLWYIPKDSGRPLLLTANSTRCKVLLTARYGINHTTQDYSYITAQIQAYVHSLPATAEIISLSYYDNLSDSLYLHLGNRDVLHITKTQYTVVPNGTDDIIFGFKSFNDPIKPEYTPTDNSLPWYKELFQSSLDYVLTPNKDEALAVLTAWFLMILFRSATTTRPILAILGSPGSGKSTLARQVYKIIYGRGRDLNKIGKVEDYNLTTSQNPLVIFDNLDTWLPWLPDALATSTTETEIEIRRLYTDYETVKIKLQAIVAVTAHSPKFIREDVVDRLLIIMLRRRDGGFGDEKALMDNLLRARNRIWGAIVTDIQRILNTPRPKEHESPDIRMKDFAALGLWCTRAIGIETDFVNGIKAIQGGQQNLVVEEEAQLIAQLTQWVKTNPTGEAVNATRIWKAIQHQLAHDPSALREFNKAYRNEVFFGKKLMTMQAALKSRFEISFEYDSRLGSRVWSIKQKQPS